MCSVRSLQWHFEWGFEESDHHGLTARHLPSIEVRLTLVLTIVSEQGRRVVWLSDFSME